MSHQDAPSDQETDIADNPLLSRIDAELRRARKRSDRILWIGLGITTPAALWYQSTTWRATWFEIALVAAVVIAIAGQFMWTVRLKRDVAIKNGLVCAHCGTMPAVHMIMSAATTQRCEKCRLRLPIADRQRRSGK